VHDAYTKLEIAATSQPEMVEEKTEVPKVGFRLNGNAVIIIENSVIETILLLS
jgi:hypothetical protein